jgi:hypothetical protein
MQSGAWAPNVLPPSLEIVSAMNGVGQCWEQVFGSPYRVVIR